MTEVHHRDPSTPSHSIHVLRCQRMIPSTQLYGVVVKLKIPNKSYVEVGPRYRWQLSAVRGLICRPLAVHTSYSSQHDRWMASGRLMNAWTNGMLQSVISGHTDRPGKLLTASSSQDLHGVIYASSYSHIRYGISFSASSVLWWDSR